MRPHWVALSKAFKLWDTSQHPLSTTLQKTQALCIEKPLQARGVLGALRQRHEPELEGSYVRLARLLVGPATSEQL